MADILNEPEEYGDVCGDDRILESGTAFTRRDSSWHIYDGYHKHAHYIDAKMPSKRKFISNFLKVGYNGENYAGRFNQSRRQWIEEGFSLANSAKDILSDDRMMSWDSQHRQRTSRVNPDSSDAFCSKGFGNVQIHQERPTRGLSAPPFYRKKTRFVAEAGKQNHSQKVFRRKHSSFGQVATGHLPTKFRVDATCKMEHDIDMEQISAGTSPMTFHESRDYGTKSRNSYLPVNTNHAADERIRLEELRKKVWSGKVKKVMYLDSENKCCQRWHIKCYTKDQVESWGWICSIHTKNSVSFQKNFTLITGWPTVVTLALAETDGSSIMPPSVLRVLNFKASRECSLLVEELKKTKLCFKCAHGRPTAIPLLNLDKLHKQAREFSMLDDRPNHSWHGLCRYEINLKRTIDRLHAALR